MKIVRPLMVVALIAAIAWQATMKPQVAINLVWIGVVLSFLYVYLRAFADGDDRQVY